MVPSPQSFDLFVLAWLGIAVLTFVALFFIKAPYGRHSRAGWGPTISSRAGWIIMETPSPLIIAYFFYHGGDYSDPAKWTFFALWFLHYTNRSWIYPFRAKLDGKTMPLAIALMAIGFNGVNAGINGIYLFNHPVTYGDEWLLDPRFIGGLLLFIGGMFVNLQSDSILRNLRGENEAGYKIPYGGAYRWVSFPNYLGEIIEWLGFALMTWSMTGLAFAVWTIANLAPRARDHHNWYQKTFNDYPKDRRALIPGLF